MIDHEKAVQRNLDNIITHMRAYLVLYAVALEIERGPKRKGKAAKVKKTREEALAALSIARRVNNFMPRDRKLDIEAELQRLREVLANE